MSENTDKTIVDMEDAKEVLEKRLQCLRLALEYEKDFPKAIRAANMIYAYLIFGDIPL